MDAKAHLKEPNTPITGQLVKLLRIWLAIYGWSGTTISLPPPIKLIAISRFHDLHVTGDGFGSLPQDHSMDQPTVPNLVDSDYQYIRIAAWRLNGHADMSTSKGLTDRVLL